MADDEQAPRRTARNEAIFREVNEALKAGHWPGEEGDPIAFRCECGRLGCSRLVELTSKEYERIRAHPRRFLVAPGHDDGRTETAVNRHDHYVVVEKHDEAGRQAEETDPRS